MFDLRYHVASLAAVFLALAIGILLGVAISGKVSSARDSLNEFQVDQLRQQLTNEQARSAAEQRRGQAATELNERSYSALMADRLAGKKVAVVFLGPADGGLLSAADKTLQDAGAGEPVRTVALDLPLDPVGLDAFLAADDALAGYASSASDFGDLGAALGRELREGGEIPVLSAVSSQLVEQRSGAPTLGADAIVVVASWRQPAAGDADTEQSRATESLVDGVLRGLDDGAAPVVGIAMSTGPPKRTEPYRSHGISSVDDVDLAAGRVALAVLLAGGQPGHYGVSPSASDGIVPPIPPVVAER